MVFGSHTRIALLCLACLASLAATPRLVAQGSQQDYDRAASYGERTRNKVFRDDVRVHWFTDATRCWYRVETAPGVAEFDFVDAETGSRTPAFDHQQLAQALAEKSGSRVNSNWLPFTSIDFDDDAKSVRFAAFGKRWTFDRVTGDLAEAAGSEPIPDTGLIRLAAPRPSRRTGDETEVRFVNRTAAAVRLFWIDPAGEHRPYAAIPAGRAHVQQTYDGHVWLVTDPDERPLAVFQATGRSAEAVIDGTQRPSRRAAGRLRTNAVSPDGTAEAVIHNHNVVLRRRDRGREAGPEAVEQETENSTASDVAGNEEIRLTSAGSEVDPFLPRFYWSPDSQKLVVVQERKGEEQTVHLIESSPQDRLQPKLHSFTYAKPGDRMPLPRPRLFDVASGRQIDITEELFPNPWSISELRWSPDSSRFTFLYNQRNHQVQRIIEVDAHTGAARVVVDEHSSTFIDYAHKQFSHYCDEAREVIWMSERDGWNHLYLYDAQSGQVQNQITRGHWAVRGVEHVDDEKRQVWFRAGGIHPDQDPYHVHLCRVNFDGSDLAVLTDGDGTHRWTFSPDRRFFVDTWSRVDQPPVTALRRSEDGRLVCPLEQADWSRLLETGWQPPERFVAKGRDGSTDIYGIIVRPTNFDPARTYPVIEHIYAGPQGAFVPKAFGRLENLSALAELGFLVVQIDGMGTSHRSKAFHDVCWKNLGDAGFADRILWLRAAAAEHPEMDLGRVGIFGGSAGGQNALRGLLAHGDFYKVGVADCGCHDNRMDKIWWNELWMGWPVGPHYAEASNVTHARRLTGKLLLIVGELDRNVDPASTMQVVDALVKADKDFDLLVIPGAGHGAAGTPYGRRRLRDFFVRHLLHVEPRWRP